MVSCFSRKYKKVEREIEISVTDTDNLSSIVLKEDGNTIDCNKEKNLFEFDRKVKNYNNNMLGNKREIFDNLFLAEYRNLAKVIGILDGYGHFFVSYANVGSGDSVFYNVESIKGKTSVDWDVINEKSTGPMAYYITTDCESRCGRTELEGYYNQGLINKICYCDNETRWIVYCLDSDILKNVNTVFVSNLREKVGNQLKNMFPDSDNNLFWYI